MTADRFRVSDYTTILSAARDAGYRFRTFVDEDDGGRTVYVRHDVDHSVEAAYAMAQLEASLDVRSTYLFLLRSPNYNAFHGASARQIQAIASLGHEVGLHFDAAEVAAHDTDEELCARILEDAELLERAVGIPARVFAFHNPTERGRFTVDAPGLVNAYAARFFADACYLSESNMRWPAGSPAAVLARGEHRVVQLLVHPLSYRADLRSDRDVVLRFLAEKVEELAVLNTSANRVLRESGLTVREVAEHLLEESRGA